MQNRIDSDISEALKKGDRSKADALRLLKSTLINARIALRHDLTDEEVIKVIRKEIKSRIEARDLYAANNRQELADKEEFERSVYTSYIPKELSEAEIKTIVVKEAKSLDEVTFAKLMPLVIKAVAGKADGRIVSDVVKKYMED